MIYGDRETLRKLSDQELSGLLVTTDLTESDSSRLVAMGLLDTTGLQIISDRARR